jgi:hypothetical protein
MLLTSDITTYCRAAHPLALHLTLVALQPHLLRTFLVFTAPIDFLYSILVGTQPKIRGGKEVGLRDVQIGR